MRFRRLIVGAIVLGACRDASNPAALDAPGFSAALQEVAQDTNPSQMAVAQVVPGFGGYFLDAAERPAVYLGEGEG
jgi:regulator of RNase E activity RraA